MKITSHIAVSTAASAGFYLMTGSFTAALSSFAAGFLIDLDHLFDYWKQHPASMDIPHFFAVCEEYRLKKLYLFLHSYELALISAIMSFAMRDAVILGVFLGVSQHYIFDVLLNPVKPQAYSFAWRLFTGFDSKSFYEEGILDGKDKPAGKS